MTVGWKLDRAQRQALLDRHPPRYARAVADHVTLPSEDGETADTGLPAPITNAAIVGHADDGAGVEAMVVALNGSTARPDGGVWHVTWSLAAGREARESNDVIAAGGWAELDREALVLVPARW